MSVFVGLESNPVRNMFTTSSRSIWGRSFCFIRFEMSLRYESKFDTSKSVPNMAL